MFIYVEHTNEYADGSMFKMFFFSLRFYIVWHGLSWFIRKGSMMLKWMRYFMILTISIYSVHSKSEEAKDEAEPGMGISSKRSGSEKKPNSAQISSINGHKSDLSRFVAPNSFNCIVVAPVLHLMCSKTL